jgi:hypothetical protein
LSFDVHDFLFIGYDILYLKFTNPVTKLFSPVGYHWDIFAAAHLATAAGFRSIFFKIMIYDFSKADFVVT